MASNKWAIMAVSFWPLWRLLLSIHLPLCVYKYEGGGRSSGYANSLSNALHSAHSRPTFCEHRESGWEGLQNRCLQSYTCTGMRAIRFLGSVLATARSVCLTNADQVPHHRHCSRTALRTSAFIDCVRLHRTYTRDVSCEWSHWCLEYRSLHRVHSDLRICVCFNIVTSYVSSDTHMHIHHTGFLG
jgi:hypothetical protein